MRLRRLGWNDLYRARKVESWSRNTLSGEVTVWVDRDTSTAYVFVFGI